MSNKSISELMKEAECVVNAADVLRRVEIKTCESKELLAFHNAMLKKQANNVFSVNIYMALWVLIAAKGLYKGSIVGPALALVPNYGIYSIMKSNGMPFKSELRTHLSTWLILLVVPILAILGGIGSGICLNDFSFTNIQTTTTQTTTTPSPTTQTPTTQTTTTQTTTTPIGITSIPVPTRPTNPTDLKVKVIQEGKQHIDNVVNKVKSILQIIVQ
jgi:hypothetical protein